MLGCVRHVLIDCERRNKKKSHYIEIDTKDGRNMRFFFASIELCSTILFTLKKLAFPPFISECFAFKHFEALQAEAAPYQSDSTEELKALLTRANTRGQRKVKYYFGNAGVTLIPSYPSTLLLPENVSDAEIGVSSKIRINKRFPTLVWHSNEHDCSIWRASCIDPNLMMERCPEDEKVLKAIAQINPAKKLFIIDA